MLLPPADQPGIIVFSGVPYCLSYVGPGTAGGTRDNMTALDAIWRIDNRMAHIIDYIEEYADGERDYKSETAFLMIGEWEGLFFAILNVLEDRHGMEGAEALAEPANPKSDANRDIINRALERARG